jgi:hypothetical protein
MNHYLANHKIITAVLPEMKLKQLRYEIDTWKRLLDFTTEENIRFKIRITELLKDNFDRSLLEEVDRFQSRIIRQEEITSLLRDEIRELDNLLEKQVVKNGKTGKVLDNKLKWLRRNMKMAENRFVEIKKDFNHFLLQNI